MIHTDGAPTIATSPRGCGEIKTGPDVELSRPQVVEPAPDVERSGFRVEWTVAAIVGLIAINLGALTGSDLITAAGLVLFAPAAGRAFRSLFAD